MTTTDDAHVLRTSHLLEKANAAGFDVSQRQLTRWRQHGLLPEVEQRGTRGSRGSEVLWPRGSDRQLLAVCALRQRFRKLDDLLLAAWWEGWAVDSTALLKVFETRLARSPLAFADHAATEDERFDAIDRMMARADLTRIHGPLREALRLVGPNEADRRSFLTAVFGVGAGLAPPVEAVDAGVEERGLGDILASGFGFGGWARQLTGVGDPTTADDLLGGIVDLSSQIKPMLDHAHDVVAAGDLEEICAARDQFRCVAGLRQIADEGLLTEPDGGLGHMGHFVPADDPDDWIAGVVTVLWLRHLFPGSLAEFTMSIEHATAPLRVINAIPELKELLTTVGGDPEALARAVESRPDLGEQIASYLDEHPETAEILDRADQHDR